MMKEPPVTHPKNHRGNNFPTMKILKLGLVAAAACFCGSDCAHVDARSEIEVHRRPRTLARGSPLAISVLNFFGARQPWSQLCPVHARRMHVVAVPAALSGLAHTHPGDAGPAPRDTENVFAVAVPGAPRGGRHGVFFDYVLNQDGCDVEMATHMREHGLNRSAAVFFFFFSDFISLFGGIFIFSY
jgi:hypothetical protein